MTKEEIKWHIDNDLMSWEKSELANSLITHKEVLRECSIEEVMRFTPFYVAEEAPDEVKARDFDTWELVDELKRRKDPDALLDEFDRNDIVGYVLSHFSDFEDDPELCRCIVRFVLRDELKDYIKTVKEI